jgi:DNA replication protein DnaC
VSALNAEESTDRTLRLMPSHVDNVEEWTRAQREIESTEWPWPVRALEVARSADPTDTILNLQRWYDSDENAERPIAVVSGSYGIGKTVALVWVGLYRLAFERPRFITAQQLARMSREGRFAFVDEMFDGETNWSNVLLLDDVGAEHADARGSWLADFDEIVDRFYRTKYMLVLSTNLTAKAFRLRYGMRVCDRLAECGKWFDIAGESMRGRP